MFLYFIILIKLSYLKNNNLNWGLGIGDWGLGIGDWGLGAIPNPQSPIPNPHINNKLKLYKNILLF